MGVVLDNGGQTDKMRGYSTPLKWHSENAVSSLTRIVMYATTADQPTQKPS